MRGVPLPTQTPLPVGAMNSIKITEMYVYSYGRFLTVHCLFTVVSYHRIIQINEELLTKNIYHIPIVRIVS